MKRILFLALWTVPFFCLQARAIEIFANGHQYQSLEAYQASKKINKAKTYHIRSNNISEVTRHKLYVLSIEKGMVNALRNFYQGHQAGHQVSRGMSDVQLQKAIEQAVTESKDPKFLISESGKVRVMALEKSY